MDKKIKVLVHSNYSRMVTGFGKNMKNILLALYNDPDIEVVEAANGVPYGAVVNTPWKCYGTAPSDHKIIQEIGNDGLKQQMASYGFYCIDSIIEECKPDVYIGIEDIWAFREFEKKPWWKKIKKVIWTTLDSVPLLPEAKLYSDLSDKFLVWASFAEEEMKKNNISNVETLHGAIDYTNFRPLANRRDIRKKFNIDDSFVIGFVFKNQLRKSVPNLLEGFRLFQESNPTLKTKLLLHTDWAERNHAWDIPRFIHEKKLKQEDILASYVCHQCANYFLHSYIGEEKDCPACGSLKTVHTKNSGVGVSENQLNEIYNCMDVYCHPFTSGGQELPIQEAKAAGLITLVTDYSCGSDSCNPIQGGLPLEWEEYREPHTQFIKATTKASSIKDQLQRVLTMSQEEKDWFIKNASLVIHEKFELKLICKRIKEICQELAKEPIPEFVEEEPIKQVFFEDFLDKDDEGKRLAVVIPESAEDVLMVNSLLENIKKTYPDYNLYVITKTEYFDLIEDSPFLHKLIPFQDGVDNLHLLEGKSDHKGYFEIAFLPHVGTQKYFNYHHNGKDKIQFKLT